MSKFKVKLNSIEKVESILQEVYDDAIRQQTLIQGKISELENSTNLAETPIDMKAKYAKAIHDYITDKEKAIGRKLEVSRLMAEILKANGDVEKVLSDKDIMNNLDSAFSSIRNKAGSTKEDEAPEIKSEIYKTNSGK